MDCGLLTRLESQEQQTHLLTLTVDSEVSKCDRRIFDGCVQDTRFILLDENSEMNDDTYVQ
jgi:hypothetical protein